MAIFSQEQQAAIARQAWEHFAARADVLARAVLVNRGRARAELVRQQAAAQFQRDEARRDILALGAVDPVRPLRRRWEVAA